MIVSFFNNQTGFSTASSLIGSLIGFLAGVYIPMGNMPISVQRIIEIFPLSHAAALMRQALINGVLDISQIPMGFKTAMGVNFDINGTVLTNFQHVLYLLGTSVIFLALAILSVSRKNKKI
jgi:ABC-type polysaccharide/polyol phosphate export permease